MATVIAVIPVFGHAAGDDFDGCSSCWDAQHADGIAEPTPCEFPSPTLIDRAEERLLSGAIETAPCEHCGHAVSLGRYLS